MFSLYGCAPVASGAAQAASATESGGFGGGWWMILIYVALFGALYFFLIRPNSKKKKEEQEMRNNIAIGDEVTTIGGIVGRIVAVKSEEDAFIIETGSDRVKMKFKKWAISSVDTKKDPVQAEDKPKKEGFLSRFTKSKDQ